MRPPSSFFLFFLFIYSSFMCSLRTLSRMEFLSSRNVTQTQNQEIISTNMKVKKTRFFSISPPQPAGTYDGLWTGG